jgi:23S rRNA pseudouridine1911/1915/1917 synthase
MKTKLTVTEADSGSRLDLFIVKHLNPGSRSAVRKWFDRGLVLVNNKAAKASQRLKLSDVILVETPESEPEVCELVPWNFPITILYEDEYLLAADKPSGIVTHPGAGNREHTMAHAVLNLRPEIANVGNPMRPGIVHRLDKETSGVLLFAKTSQSYWRLSSLFKDRKIEKHYRALAFGQFRLKTGKIDLALGRDPRNRKKISIRARKSRSAVTHFRVLRQLEFAAILDVRIETGRTHQIRVHLSSENHPIVGDRLYGGGNWGRIPDVNLRNRLKHSNFFGLHAFSLDFQHPFTHSPIHIESPLPASWGPIA